MCGIVAVTGYKKALPLLINGLEKLEYRGYDSAGIAIINSETNCISCNKAEGKLKNLISNLNDNNIPGTVGIGHTRWATHGKPEVKMLILISTVQELSQLFKMALLKIFKI